MLHALKVEIAPDKTYSGKAQKGFDFLGKRILPIGLLPSTTALSRLQKNTVRLYEQGATQQRIGRYWRRWLGWALIFVPTACLSTTVPDSAGDTSSSSGHETFCTILGCSTGSAPSNYVTSDNSAQFSDSAFDAMLPDADPDGASNPARFYSWAATSPTASVAPNIVCGTGINGTPAKDTHSTRVELADNTSCALTFTPVANSGPLSDIVYTGTLSRSGSLYSLTGGTICGTNYTPCAVVAASTALDRRHLGGFILLLGLFLVWGVRVNKKLKTH